MDKLGKVIVTIVALVIFVVMFAAIVGVRSDNGSTTPGIFGLAAFAAVVAALRSIWKKDDKNDDPNMDIDKFDKEN